MRIGVVSFYGSLDDRDTHRAIRLAGGEAVPVWFANAASAGDPLADVDAVVVPGGASYGDYLRAGAIAAREPIVQSIRDAAERGVPVLGIGNGFQILVEAGLLPGAFTRNEGQTFVRRDQTVRIASAATPWTRLFTVDEEIILPLRSAHGRYVVEDPAALHVVARYSGENPNGSVDGIAGVANSRGNVVGLIVHPEFAVEPGFGPDTPARMCSGVDGLRLFEGLVATSTA